MDTGAADVAKTVDAAVPVASGEGDEKRPGFLDIYEELPEGEFRTELHDAIAGLACGFLNALEDAKELPPDPLEAELLRRFRGLQSNAARAALVPVVEAVARIFEDEGEGEGGRGEDNCEATRRDLSERTCAETWTVARLA